MSADSESNFHSFPYDFYSWRSVVNCTHNANWRNRAPFVWVFIIIAMHNYWMSVYWSEFASSNDRGFCYCLLRFFFQSIGSSLASSHRQMHLQNRKKRRGRWWFGISQSDVSLLLRYAKPSPHTGPESMYDGRCPSEVAGICAIVVARKYCHGFNSWNFRNRWTRDLGSFSRKKTVRNKPWKVTENELNQKIGR